MELDLKYQREKLLSLTLFLLLYTPPSAFAFNLFSIEDILEKIQIKDQFIFLQNLKNPLPNSDYNYIKGAEVYFKNCFLCHGDLLDGKGVFGDRFFPPPANFLSINSIISKPEAYAFWRIIKGGPGLPNAYEPWNSAMPAWENQLSNEEIWQVIQFLFRSLKDNPGTSPSRHPNIKRGRKVYIKNCLHCHGSDGKGKGVAAPFMSPPPRNLTKGQFKFRSTPFGKIPTDKDFMNLLNRGLPNTAMPGWRHLPEIDRLSLMAYIKSISRKFQRFIKKNKTHRIIKVPKPDPFNLKSLKRGKELYLVNCSGCHGVKGRSDGTATERIVDIPNGAIWPRNLSQPWTFRRGSRREDIYMTMRTGLYGSTMPMFSTRTHTDKQVWDIVHYVQTLGLREKPEVKRVLKVSKINTDLPTTPEDPKWKSQTTYFIPLGGQLIEEEKLYFPVITNINFNAIYNGDEIAFKVQWDDPTVDPFLLNNQQVKESPPPPLPKKFKQHSSHENNLESESRTQKFSDAIALQFPIENNVISKPYFLNGDTENSVSLWKWESKNPFQVQVLRASGIKHISVQDKNAQDTSAQFSFSYGQYSVVMKGKLTTPNKNGNVQFSSDHKIGIAFNAWDGFSGENKTKMAISSWFDLELE